MKLYFVYLKDTLLLVQQYLSDLRAFVPNTTNEGLTEDVTSLILDLEKLKSSIERAIKKIKKQQITR